MNTLDRIADKMGFVRREELEEAEASSERLVREHIELGREKDRLEEIAALNTNAIARAITGARMVTVHFDTPEAWWTMDGDPPQADRHIHERTPPEPQWYQIAARVDVAVLRRAYDDLVMHGKLDPEMDYLLDSLMYKLRREIEALMKVALIK